MDGSEAITSLLAKLTSLAPPDPDTEMFYCLLSLNGLGYKLVGDNLGKEPNLTKPGP